MKVSTKNGLPAEMPLNPLILDGRVYAENVSLLEVGGDCTNLPEAQIDDDHAFHTAELVQRPAIAVGRHFLSWLIAVNILFSFFLTFVLATRSKVAV